MTVMLEPEQITDVPAAAPVRQDQPRGDAAVDAFDVSVCIVSWNIKDLLRDCLRSLGPATGRLLAEMMTGQTPFVDPAPYAAERFGLIVEDLLAVVGIAGIDP